MKKLEKQQTKIKSNRKQ